LEHEDCLAESLKKFVNATAESHLTAKVDR
jgi:hypothetical protein